MADRMHWLSREELTRVHDSSMELLARAGVNLHSEAAAGVFAKHGSRVEGTKVFPDEKLILRAVESAPEEFRLFGRDPDKSVTVGSGRPVLAPAYGAPFVTEADGNRRSAMVEDYRTFCKLVQTSDQLDMNGYLMVQPADVAPETGHLDMILANLTLCDKPFLGSPVSAQAARDSFDMAALVWGGLEALKSKPVMSAIISAMTPLQYSREMSEVMMEYAAAGQPCLCASAIMAGSSGPVNLAGVIALQNAEVLTGIALGQLINPGIGAIYGGTSAPMDMRNGAMCIGAVETAMMASATVQTAEFYGLPVRTGGTLTDSLFPDAQAGLEGTMVMLASMRDGVDFVLHAAGILGSFMSMSFEKFLIDEEICAMILKLISPMDFSAEAIDLETLVKVGPGGHYLTQPKTLQLCRTEFYMPRVVNRTNQAQWDAAGRPRLDQRAQALLAERLAGYEKPDMDPAVERELTEFVRRRKG